MNQNGAKVGVYVCQCGINISSTVDVEEVRAFASKLNNVEVARQYQFMCSEPGQAMIKKDIQELGVNRVVVASCSPRMHEPTFQAVLKDSGINPYYFDMANIREHCSWITTDKEKGTEKAKRLVAGSVSRVVWQEPLTSREVSVIPKAMVVGGGIAGVQASLAIADAGYHVYLVEKDPSIGGRMAQLDKTFPTLDCSACILTPKMVQVGRHPNITLLSYSEVTGVSGYVGNFKVTVKKKPRYVDKAKCTGCAECAKVCPVEVPSEFDMKLGKRKAIYRPFAQAIPSAFVIDKRKSPCKMTCPAHIPVQGYVALIGQGKFSEAWDLIRETMPFPSVCGRVCTHPCESECKRGEVDEPIAIAALKRAAADFGADYKKSNQTVAKTKNQNVAVVGSGPAGIAAAYDLARKGYGVTIFEALPVAGGMLAVCIPEYRLPKDILNAEIMLVQNLGVNIKLNHRIDDTATLLNSGFQAVLVATGAFKGTTLNIPGKDLPGVYDAIEFLKKTSLGEEVKVGKRVAVIGGGNSAVDAARVALRQGAEWVQVFYRREKQDMPAVAAEVEAAEAEGIHFNYLSLPTKIISNGRKGPSETLSAMEYGKTEIKLDSKNRRAAHPVAGSEQTIPLDTVIFAIGQTPDLTIAPEGKGFKITRENTIAVHPENMSTGVKGVFAAGDVADMAGTVIEAISAGKKAARSIDLFLQGQELPQANQTSEEKARDVKVEIPVGTVKTPRMQSKEIPPTQRVHNFKEVVLGLSRDEAISEAKRCLSCAVCSECSQCVTACLPKCIDHNMQEEEVEFDVGSILLATGHDFFHADLLPQYNYGRYPNIIESMEFERLCSASGPTGGKILLADGTTPKSVAIIHCVGSRDYHTNSYCSRLCCMHAMKQAHLVKEKTGARVYELYMDIRASGKGYEEFYERVQREGVIFIRGRGAEVFEQSGKLVVRAEDTGLGRPLTLPVDLVILSTGMVARTDSEKVAGTFHITRDKHGFFMEQHPKLKPFHSNSEGIFLAGTCQSPRDIPDTVAHAAAAASEVLSLLAKGKVTIEPLVSRIDQDLCSHCMVCVPLCPYQAITVEGSNGQRKVEVNEVLCKGCGTCVAACPAGAIAAMHFTDQEILSQIEGILAAV
jgi:heterodisulfide reductase subunit A